MPGTSDPKPDTIRAELALSQPNEAIVIESVSKRFGDQLAVNDVSLTIREGEFFSLLGPSGCGKTTLLRMLAGFLEPDAGRVTLRGDDVTHRPPNKRPVNMVFQHYELFPHMTVFANVAYGLRLKKVPKREIGERVGEMLGILGCEASPNAEHPSSQVASSNASRSPARSSTAPPSCCSTNHCRHSTSSSASARNSNSRASRTSSARPSST